MFNWFSNLSLDIQLGFHLLVLSALTFSLGFVTRDVIDYILYKQEGEDD